LSAAVEMMSLKDTLWAQNAS